MLSKYHFFIYQYLAKWKAIFKKKIVLFAKLFVFSHFSSVRRGSVI